MRGGHQPRRLRPGARLTPVVSFGGQLPQSSTRLGTPRPHGFSRFAPHAAEVSGDFTAPRSGPGSRRRQRRARTIRYWPGPATAVKQQQGDGIPLLWNAPEVTDRRSGHRRGEGLAAPKVLPAGAIPCPPPGHAPASPDPISSSHTILSPGRTQARPLTERLTVLRRSAVTHEPG